MIVAATCLLACSETGAYRVELRFESDELVAQTAWVRVGLVESCDPQTDPGTGQVVRDFSSPTSLPGVMPGPQFVSGWAYSATCGQVATGCTAFDAVSGASVTIKLPLVAARGPSDCSQCDPSVCDDADGGPETCAPFELVCDDGEDGDCDGLTDCLDPDCSNQACSDDNGCTENDACVDFQCVGVGMECDDQNPCTDNTCVEGACTFVNNSVACDDGFWCNGADTCDQGACSIHSDAPCEQFCNESKNTCDQCASDADCGTQEIGEWSQCQFAGTCPTTGTRTRSVKTPRCVAGACTLETSQESGMCTRASTNGTSCGSVRYGNWSSCKYSNACVETGSRTRDVFTPKCSGGACSEVKTTQSGSCSRNVTDGKSCGGTWMRCCNGTCRDLRTNKYCGSCAVDCTEKGRTCVSSGNGGYHCTCANSNAQCQALYNNAATCYQNRCNCQCSSNGVCVNGGCGPNFYCHDVPGQNYCAPFR